MSFRIDITCTDCGKTAKFTLDSFGANQEFKPEPAEESNGLKVDGGCKVEDLELSVRAWNCLTGIHGPLPRDTATVSDVLNLEHPHALKNFGKVTFCEIVAALEVVGGCSMEQIQKSRFWTTASQPCQDMIGSVRYQNHKAHIERWISFRYPARSERAV